MIIIINLMKLFKHKFKTNKDDSKVCMLYLYKDVCSMFYNNTQKSRDSKFHVIYEQKF